MKYKTIIKKYEEYQEKNKLNDLLAILIRKASKYSSEIDEKNFVINIITKDNRYSSYIESQIYNLEDQILYDNEYNDEEIELYICTYEIDTIIDKFIQTGYPTIKLDSVVDRIGDIFEKVVGETQGYLRDENGVWHKFGDNNDKYTDLLGSKYPGFYDSVCCNEEKREKFIEWLDELTQPNSWYEYNEIDLIDQWY